MTKKQKKRKTKEPEIITYEVKVENWKTYYNFGINKSKIDIFPGPYWEFSDLILLGKIISPDIQIASEAKVKISESPELNDHWKDTYPERNPTGIGWMEIEKGDDVLHLSCWVSSHSFNNILIAVSNGRVKYASIFGTKLKWRKGTIFDITLSTDRDEE